MARDGSAAPSERKSTILVVDDDLGAIQLMGRILAGLGQVRFAATGEDALRLARRAPPDVVLLDGDMPGMSGFEVCRAIKADPVLAETPVIFVTSFSGVAFEIAGFEAGASDFIAKPISPPIVEARVRTQLRMKHLTDQLRALSTIDALTGVANRRRFDDALEREWLRARRSREPLALLLVDVDHFKLYNDHAGHPAGDACLRAVAQTIAAAALRPADLVARYGGEEFAALLPQTEAPGAEHVARRILTRIDQLGLAHPASPTASHVTVSIGASSLSPGPEPRWSEPADEVRIATATAELLASADRALYAAKHRGRAQVVLDAPAPSAPLRASVVTDDLAVAEPPESTARSVRSRS